MKKEVLKFISICLGVLITGFIFSCCSGDGSNSKSASSDLPLNITVFLDLSDRLTREMTPPQMERDTAIIRYVGDYFVDQSVKGGKLLQSKNCFQILFYPTPNSSEINAYAKKLKVNLSDTKAAEKKKVLTEFKNDLNATTGALYQEVLKYKNWTGCDIWRFFSDKKVDQQCIKDDYRNIVIILTDGYLFETNDKIQEGNAYSYILPQTLKNPESSLIVKRNGLEDLEVLMLEANPYETPDINKMKEVLDDWFKEMGVKKFVVAETDIPENIKIIVKDFLK